ncbi:Hypothetical protein SRAE_2000409500 [Strongyloides ratti]|uniref:Uncharacterized protein n=1 Tax=Strongyloides ratti TaxID=34506 RepID=A0A090LI04_STRRB|nr:Hypothetical protein SRAE_2000409500 [Strongyloides ratti]CEF69446.1 Hypothetical protein SRAE_2000409500 [Strongyloides ratti]
MKSSQYKSHHGFNEKTRNMLINNHTIISMNNEEPSLSLSEINKMIKKDRKTLSRNDSTLTTDSVQSTGSTKSMPNQDNFDNILGNEDNDNKIKPNQNLKKFLGLIGKTRSEANFFDGKPSKTVIKTFQQQNIVKLPSLECDMETQNRINQYKEVEASIDRLVNDTMVGSRRTEYEMK